MHLGASQVLLGLLLIRFLLSANHQPDTEMQLLLVLLFLYLDADSQNVGRYISALNGKHAFIHNDAGNSASYLIKAARPDADGCIITLDLDPRIGEGFVNGCEDSCVISGTDLRLARYSYYAGKTIANEDHSAMYRLNDVEDRVRCMIHEENHGQITADVLSDQFGDRDGDGLSRFIIYDYGPGDMVTIKNIAVFH